ncbi:MAG: Rrf2 family transcriptional regulator [Candidatus Kapabacteria bacterium]|nr:Rrf2 family transcriptional regulator [Candidatus Kapabacteria bacterium]
MLKLSKRVEYALLAMQDMAQRPDAIVSAKDVAERYSISQALVAKVLQQLVRDGVVRSYAGVNGGYALSTEPSLISIERVIQAIEGQDNGLVDCQDSEDHECSALGSCTIREPLSVLQERIKETFRSMSIAELASPKHFVQLEVT